MMYLAAIEMFTRSMNINTPMQKIRVTMSQRVRVGESLIRSPVDEKELERCVGRALHSVENFIR
jgi:hypothetical protein